METSKREDDVAPDWVPGAWNGVFGRSVCPLCRQPFAHGSKAWKCPRGCGALMIDAEHRRLDGSAFLAATATASVARVTWAYRLYSLAYAPLALINMLTVWQASLGRLVSHYRRALGESPSPVLDVAIGDGALTGLALRGLSASPPPPPLLGLDIAASMLDKASANLARFPAIWTLQADARRIPFADATFDRVCCYGGLHVIPHPDEAIAEMARVLVTGGRFHASILLDPGGRGPAYLARRYVDLGFLSTCFSRANILERLARGGLPPISVEDNGRMLLVNAVRAKR